MRVYGNLMNRIAELCKQPTPKVGMGCTINCYSDRHAATIVEVRTPRMILVKQDNSKRTDKNGMSESQDYEYSPNPDSLTQVFTKRKDGVWRERNMGTGLTIGVRDTYYDYSF